MALVAAPQAMTAQPLEVPHDPRNESPASHVISSLGESLSLTCPLKLVKIHPTIFNLHSTEQRETENYQ